MPKSRICLHHRTAGEITVDWWKGGTRTKEEGSSHHVQGGNSFPAELRCPCSSVAALPDRHAERTGIRLLSDFVGEPETSLFLWVKCKLPLPVVTYSWKLEVTHSCSFAISTGSWLEPGCPVVLIGNRLIFLFARRFYFRVEEWDLLSLLWNTPILLTLTSTMTI
jgi:hypothetical protein